MLQKIYATIKEVTSKKPLLAAVVAGILGCLFASGYLASREAEILRVSEPIKVAIASRDILIGEVIDEGAAILSPVPRRFVEPASFDSLDKLVGRIAVTPIKAGTQITLVHAQRPNVVRGLSGIIPAGKRAISLSLSDASGLLGLIKPNDIVDILATFDLGQESSVKRTTLTVVENVQVLAVNNEVGGEQPKVPQKEERNGIFLNNNSANTMRNQEATVTVAATPKEAQAIAYSQESGAVRLILKGFGDEVAVERTPPTNMGTISGGYDELVPMKKGFREYRGR